MERKKFFSLVKKVHSYNNFIIWRVRSTYYLMKTNKQ